MKKMLVIFLVGLLVGWATVPLLHAKKEETLPFLIQKDDMDHAGMFKMVRRIIDVMTQLAATSEKIADNTKQIADNTKAIREKLEAK